MKGCHKPVPCPAALPCRRPSGLTQASRSRSSAIWRQNGSALKPSGCGCRALVRTAGALLALGGSREASNSLSSLRDHHTRVWELRYQQMMPCFQGQRLSFLRGTTVGLNCEYHGEGSALPGEGGQRAKAEGS